MNHQPKRAKINLRLNHNVLNSRAALTREATSYWQISCYCGVVLLTQ